MKRNVLIVAAHIGDFVWRCGGTAAKHVQDGDTVHLIVLTYGIRGETNSYWKLPEANEEECKRIRHEEGAEAARILGIQQVDILDFADYPITLNRQRIEQLAGMIRAFQPDIILTHDSACDPYNTDHTQVGEKIYEMCAVAAAAGADIQGLKPVKRPVVYGFEPHVSEIAQFEPSVFIDITSTQAVKEQAMQAYATQKNMLSNYINRAKIRAQQSKIKGCVYAEAFSCRKPVNTQEFLPG